METREQIREQTYQILNMMDTLREVMTNDNIMHYENPQNVTQYINARFETATHALTDLYNSLYVWGDK